MADAAGRVRRFSAVIGDDALQFGDRQIFIAPALGKEDGQPLSAYTAFFGAGERADLPAPYAEIWVILTGAVRVGTEADSVTAQGGDFVHVPEQAPGVVEALQDTRMVCVSVPAH